MRPRIVAGNWKMNGDFAFVRSYLSEFLGSGDLVLAARNGVSVMLAPPATLLSAVHSELARSDLGQVQLAAQNVASTCNGAFTGEVSAEMLQDAGCSWCIVGHSERRAHFGETDQDVVAKISRLLERRIRPIVCVGESLVQRDLGDAELIVSGQIDAVLDAFTPEQLQSLAIAYEPVWAIGTGRTASPEQAQQMHEVIRARLSFKSESLAQRIAILYGGSVNSGNAKELFAQPDVDGGLVGGASLKALEFAHICGQIG